MASADHEKKERQNILDSAKNFVTDARYVTSGLDELGSKLAAPTLDWSSMGSAEHFVQFYENDAYIVDSVAEYIFHGLRAGETCIVIATPEHLSGIEKAVDSFGLDLGVALDDGAYVALDAEKMLAKFASGDKIDARLFQKEVGGLIGRAIKDGPVRAFGEMVAVLVRQGRPAAAVKLEELWNRLRKKHNFSLFCAYAIRDLARDPAARFMEAVCSSHSRVIPDEGYMSLTSADERLRKIASLQQRGRQLEAEVADLRSRLSEKPV